jgi:hypothetical protein
MLPEGEKLQCLILRYLLLNLCFKILLNFWGKAQFAGNWTFPPTVRRLGRNFKNYQGLLSMF